ncbi:MAG: polysaccharide biosynthesis/export family protein [bacterium]
MKTKNIYFSVQFASACLFLLASWHSLFAQQQSAEYVIGSGDVLSITFWQKPELNTEAKVTADGNIELPLIGAMSALGLTARSLRDRIVDRISLLDFTITQVAVVVKGYGSKAIYITGSVGAPGKQTFEVIPNLWQILLESGGPLPTAKLDDITIVRGEGPDAGTVIHVDLTKALEQSDFSILPQVYPGDTIHIREATTGATLSSSPLERRDAVYVFGAVGAPGLYNLEKNMDVLEALIVAGGPSEAADLKKVKLFFRGRHQAEMAIIDMNKYLKRSHPIPLNLHSGDALYVPPKGRFSSFFSSTILGETFRVIITSTFSFLIFRAL